MEVSAQVEITAQDAQQGQAAILALLLGRLQAAEGEIAALKRELLAARGAASAIATKRAAK